MRVLQIMDGKQYSGIYEIMLRLDKNIKDIDFNYLTSTKVYESDKSFDLNIDRTSIKGRIIYNHRLYKFLKKNKYKYDIVHISSGAFFFTFFCVIISKICNIKKVVVHSRNTPKINKLKRILIRILNPLYRKLTDVHLSCSTNAIKSLFTKSDDVIVLKNGIEVDKYRYNEKIREKYRKKLNLEGKKVYGHIGRFTKQKNHEFLIDLFCKLEDDSVLLLIGTGELEEKIKQKVKELNIENRVIFLGFRDDIDKLLNAIDVIIFPSLYEGFGNVVIEAQTNGLPTFVSSAVPEDANISNNYHKIETFDINDWKKEILSVKTKDRKNAYKNTIKNGFDIKDTAKQLEKIYKKLNNL